jgi:spore maturation protein CgeB
LSGLISYLIDNDELFGFYQNAKIVLNDHREEMRVLGFLSNRVYDVSASGGFLLTDYVEEIEKIYGDSIVMYKDFDDFKKKLKYYLENEDERIKKVMKAREITLREFTNVEAAKKFDIIFNSIVKN